MPDVLDSESRRKTPVSQPNQIAPPPTSTATPSPRRIHSSAPSDRFIAANTLFPASSASASEVAAPAANANNKNVVWALGPCKAAPAKINPSIGPAQGAHSNPVDTPSKTDRPTLGACCEFCPWTCPPSRTNGRLRYSAKFGNSNASPSTAKTTTAIHLPI